MTTDPAATFEPHRRRLLGLAYRMLSSMAEAEDAVQEAYLRWHDTDRENVEGLSDDHHDQDLSRCVEVCARAA
jgi:DNA-directed RNA polymerase specialized sigma24 family protein